MDSIIGQDILITSLPTGMDPKIFSRSFKNTTPLSAASWQGIEKRAPTGARIPNLQSFLRGDVGPWTRRHTICLSISAAVLEVKILKTGKIEV